MSKFVYWFTVLLICNTLHSRTHTVTDAVYGAKGDNSTDNTQAFKKAIDTARKEGGGIVYVPPGTYLFKTYSTSVAAPPRHVGCIYLPSNVTLCGAGKTSILKVYETPVASPDDAPVMQLILSFQETNIAVKSLYLYGQQVTNNIDYMDFLICLDTCSKIEVSNCYMNNKGGACIFLQSSYVMGGGNSDLLIKNNTFKIDSVAYPLNKHINGILWGRCSAGSGIAASHGIKKAVIEYNKFDGGTESQIDIEMSSAYYNKDGKFAGYAAVTAEDIRIRYNQFYNYKGLYPVNKSPGDPTALRWGACIDINANTTKGIAIIKNVNIDNNTFSGNRRPAVRIYNPASYRNTVTAIYITNNTMYDCVNHLSSFHGVVNIFGKANNIVIDSNWIYISKYTGILITTQKDGNIKHIKITNNRIHNVEQCAIAIIPVSEYLYCDQITIAKNEIRDCCIGVTNTYDAINIKGLINSDIYSNTVKEFVYPQKPRYCLHIKYGNYVFVRNNKLLNYGTGKTLYERCQNGSYPAGG
jgi:hypothetical protein